eukprot:8778270-Pyramimonas_sp.AAC.1
MTISMGMGSFPYLEKGFDQLPRLGLFNMPYLSQKTPAMPTMQPHYTVPGPATEGPAKPGTSGNGVPINADLTDITDGMTFINYHPSTKAGPAKPPTAQPSGRDK